MIPSNRETFSDQLTAIRFPKREVFRKPIEWIIPMKKLEDEDNPEKWASEQAWATMMNQIKLLQKLESDRTLTEKSLPLSNDEEVEWNSYEKCLVKGIVENFSIMEVIHNFPDHTKVEDGKVVFDLEKFKDLLSVNDKGEIFVDEYQLLAKDMEKRTKEAKEELEKKETQKNNDQIKKVVEETKEYEKQIKKMEEDSKGNEVLSNQEAIAELTSKDAVIVEKK